MSALLSPHPFWIIGHRGSPVIEVENTMSSFVRAVDQDGANSLEFDLCVTADAEVVVFHDEHPHDPLARLRRYGLEPDVRCRPLVPSDGRFRKPVRELSLRDFREHYGYTEKTGPRSRIDVEIPTLDQVIAWASKKRQLGLLFLDVKVPKTELRLLPLLLAKLDRLLREHQPSLRCVLESAHPEVIDELRRLAPHHDCSLDVEPHAGLVIDDRAASAVRAAIRHGLRYATAQKPRSVTVRPFATHCRIVEADMEEARAHNASSPAVPLECACCFTINEESEMRALIQLGVRAIQSDRPALLQKIVTELAHSREDGEKRAATKLAGASKI